MSISIQSNPFAWVLNTPIGQLGVQVEKGALLGIQFCPAGGIAPVASQGAAENKKIKEALLAYFSQKACCFEFPVVFTGSLFQKKVWDCLQKIPFGQTTTYGAIAKQLNSSPRAVGQALRKNPLLIVVPCHRVVGANGIGGFMGGELAQHLQIKRWLLAHESADRTQGND